MKPHFTKKTVVVQVMQVDQKGNGQYINQFNDLQAMNVKLPNLRRFSLLLACVTSFFTGITWKKFAFSFVLSRQVIDLFLL